MAVGRKVGEVFEEERRFAMVVQTRLRLPGRPRRRARAAAQVDARPDRAARRRRGRDSRAGARAGEPRQAVAALHRRVQRARARPGLGRGGRAGGGGLARATAGGLPRSSGAASSSTTPRRGHAWPSWCPLALGLIVFLLWLAFGKVKPALLVFVNVPFAAVGGVSRAVAARHPVHHLRRRRLHRALRRRGAERAGAGVVLPCSSRSGERSPARPSRRRPSCACARC